MQRLLNARLPGIQSPASNPTQKNEEPKNDPGTKTAQKSIYLLAYGTLRLGEPNYLAIRKKYGDSSMGWLGQHQLKGFKMYDVGYFPVIVPARTDVDIAPNGTITKNDQKVVVDIFEISQAAFAAVHKMETRAGYALGTIRIPTIQRDGKEAIGFVYYMPSLYPQIDSGDWKQYANEIIIDSPEEGEI